MLLTTNTLTFSSTGSLIVPFLSAIKRILYSRLQLRLHYEHVNKDYYYSRFIVVAMDVTTKVSK